MTRLRRWALPLIVVGLCSCKAEEDDRPPMYSPVAVPGSLVPCEALHQGGVQMDANGLVRYDGGLAECLPDGIVCTVGPCDGGLAVARCVAGRWLWGCETLNGSDAGPTKGDSGQQEASTPEASAEGG